MRRLHQPAPERGEVAVVLAEFAVHQVPLLALRHRQGKGRDQATGVEVVADVGPDTHGDAETIGTPTPTPQAQATPAPTSTSAPSTTSDPSQIPPASGGTAATPTVGDWPSGKTGYTVVLDSSSSQSTAAARAKDLAGQNIPVGLLDTSGYREVANGRYVVFSGQYATREEARVALRGLAGRVDGARVGRVAPA